MLLLVPLPANAKLIWSEDFSSSDALNDWDVGGWNVFNNDSGRIDTIMESGEVEINDAGALEMLGTYPSNTFPLNATYTYISKPSDIQYGTWHIDWKASPNRVFPEYIIFTHDIDFSTINTSASLQDQSEIGLVEPFTSIEIEIGNSISLFYFEKNLAFKNIPPKFVDEYDIPFNFDWDSWHEFIITRNENNEITVYMDGTEILNKEIVLKTSFEPQFFGLLSFPGSQWDNIEVWDTIRPQNIPPVLLFAGILAIIAIFSWFGYKYYLKRNMK